MSVSVSHFLLLDVPDVPGLVQSSVMFDETELVLLCPLKEVKTTLGSFTISMPISSSSHLLLLLLLVFKIFDLRFSKSRPTSTAGREVDPGRAPTTWARLIQPEVARYPEVGR